MNQGQHGAVVLKDRLNATKLNATELNVTELNVTVLRSR